MASANIVILAGNLTRDPDSRQVGQQTVCDLGVAVNERWKDKAGKQQDRAVFVDVVAWGATADNCARFLRKGSPVLVEGRLQFDQWEKDGEKRSKLRVRADRVQFLGRPAGQDAGVAVKPADDEPPF